MENVTIADIKNDLRNIKYYYARKKALDESMRNVCYNLVLKKVEIYNEIIKDASPQLYDLYISLYIEGHTQESLGEKMCYTRETVNVMNKKLLKYFQTKLNEKIEGEKRCV